jgi:hypothetical protein
MIVYSGSVGLEKLTKVEAEETIKNVVKAIEFMGYRVELDKPIS